jgi:hypothetical protein
MKTLSSIGMVSDCQDKSYKHYVKAFQYELVLPCPFCSNCYFVSCRCGPALPLLARKCLPIVYFTRLSVSEAVYH